MITKAWILAEIEVAFYLQDEQFYAIKLDSNSPTGYSDCTTQIALYEQTGAEQRLFEDGFESLEALLPALKTWSTRHQILNYLIYGLENRYSQQTRTLAIQAASELMASEANQVTFGVNRLLSCPPSPQTDLINGLLFAQSFENVHNVYQQLASLQRAITPVRECLADLLNKPDLLNKTDPQLLLRELIDQGVCLQAIKAFASEQVKQIDMLMFDWAKQPLIKEHQGLERQWINGLKQRLNKPREKANINQMIADEQQSAKTDQQQAEQTQVNQDSIMHAIEQWLQSFNEQANNKNNKVGKRKSRKNRSAAKKANKGRLPQDVILQKVAEQKRAIVQNFEQNNDTAAYKQVGELVDFHQKNSEPRNLCQTLCNIAASLQNHLGLNHALQLYLYAQKANSDDVVAFTGYGHVLKRLGQAKQALEVYNDIIKAFPNNVVALCGKGEVLRDLGRLDDALVIYNDTIKAFPNNVVALCGKGEVLRDLGRLDDALVVYDDTIKAFPNNVVSLCGKGEVLRDLGRLDDALVIYNDTIKAFPNNDVARNGKGEVLRDLGRLDDALMTYNDTIDAFPTDVVALCGKAEVLRDLGRLDDALVIYNDTIKAFPNSEVARNSKGEVLRDLGRLDDALVVYDDTIKAFPNNEVARNGKGEVLRDLGRLDDALVIYNDTIKAFPNNVVALCGKGEVLRDLGQMDEAIALFEATVERFPTSPVAKNALACLYILQGADDKARAILPPINKAPKNHYRWIDIHVLTMLEIKSENYANAEALLNRAFAECKNRLSLAYFKSAQGYLLVKQGHAAKVYEQIDEREMINYPKLRLILAYALAVDAKYGQMEQQLDALPERLGRAAKICQQALVGCYLANKGAYTKEQVDAAVFEMCVG